MVYPENLTLKSGIRLVGSGAATSVIDGSGTGSVLTLNGVTNVEVMGFTITNGGEDSAETPASSSLALPTTSPSLATSSAALPPFPAYRATAMPASSSRGAPPVN